MNAPLDFRVFRPRSVLDLGHMLAESETAYRRLDEDTSGANRNRDDLVTLIAEREKGLRAVIATLPAQSLADAAVQIGTAVTYASILECSEWCPEEREQLHDLHAALFRLTLSALPLIAEAAGLDLVDMFWAENAELRDRIFYGRAAPAP